MSQATLDHSHITSLIEAVADLIRRHETAWNTHDRAAFESLFTEDADFVNVIGQRAIGRTQIGADFEQIHRSFMRSTQIKILSWDTRVIDDHAAIVRLRWEMTGMQTVPGRNTPDVRHGLLTYVEVQRQGEWKVTAVQNTDEIAVKMPE